MIISAIAAVAKNRVIGKENDIPWYLPEDLKYFKRTTLNHHVIMGRKSYESVGRPLPKRTNIVVTRDPYFISTGIIVTHSIPEALSIAYKNGEKEVFILGGGNIYAQSIDLWDKLYLTEVDASPEGDVYFPEVDFSQWKLISSDKHLPDEKNPFAYVFQVYERKNSHQ
jgi:dihydrofolate reductase